MIAGRVLWAGAVAGSIIGLVASTAPAAAHVHAISSGAVRGSVAIVTFEVPNESQTDAATTGLTVALPDVTATYTETKPGWTVGLDRDTAAGTARSVTWTATADAGIGTGQFGLFRMSMKLPDVDTVHFPATQRYADGTVVHWDQPPLAGGGEPERPAPALTLASGPAPPPEHSEHQAPAQHPAPSVSADPGSTAPNRAPAADNPARLLAGAALLIAALSLTVAVVRKRS